MAEYLSEGESRFMFKRLKAAVDDQTKVRILSSSTLNGTNPWQLPTHLELTLRSTCIIIITKRVDAELEIWLRDIEPLDIQHLDIEHLDIWTFMFKC